MKGENSERIDHFDFIRGIAILGVFIFHTKLFLIHQPVKLLSTFLNTGARGVQLFFLLSGFMLFSSLSNSNYIGRADQTWRYALRRFFRIAPLFYFCLCVSCILFPASALAVFLSSTFMSSFDPSTINLVVPNQWTIMVETIFYICLPFLFLSIKNINTARKWVMGSLLFSNFFLLTYDIFSYFTNPSRVKIWDQYAFFSFPVQVPFFMIGIFLFFLLQKDSNKKYLYSKSEIWRQMSNVTGLILLMIVIDSAVLYYFTRNLLNSLQKPLFYLYSFGAAYLFILIVQNYHKFTKLNLFKRSLEYVGKVSYSLYLTHWFVFYFLTNSTLYLSYAKKMNFYVEYITLFSITFILAMLVSTLTYILIEKPGQLIGLYVASLRRAKVATSDILIES